MKPCAKYKKSIAWLALDALTAQQARELQVHVQVCDACRGYLEEVSRITTTLRSVEPTSELDVSDAFKTKLSRALQERYAHAGGNFQMRPCSAPAVFWRIAWPALATVAVALAAGFIWLHVARVVTPLPSPDNNFRDDPAPTIGNYQMVADRSLEQLDALLTRQANRALPPCPVYSVSLFSL
jgi:hypothetical protein